VFPILIKGSYPTTETQFVKPQTALLLFHQIFSTITYKPMLESILIRLLLPYFKEGWKYNEGQYPLNFSQYSYSWIQPVFLLPSTLTECTFFNNK